MSSIPISSISNHFNQQILPLMRDINFVYSPLSISFALLLVYLGSNGNTKIQLQDFFGINTIDNANLMNNMLQIIKSNEVQVGNAFIIKQKYQILPEYYLLINYLKTQLIPFNKPQEAIQRSNLWVNLQTRGLIPQLLSPNDIGQQTTMIIINTVYFKGQWSTPFDVADTQNNSFYTYQGKEVTLPLMTKTTNVPYYDDINYQSIELSYENSNFVMGIILPKNNKFIDNFMSNPKIIPIGNIPFHDTMVKIFLPKFTQKQKLEPIDLLRSLGVTDIFDFSKADLSLINNTDPLYINNIVHETIVKVNEEGTEAAAATALITDECMAMPTEEPKSILFRADHTFYYYIRSTKDQTIYFNGIFNGN